MGDARDPGDGQPLARVHDLRSRASRLASASSDAEPPGSRQPSLRVTRGRVVELDGLAAADFGAGDAFLVRHGLDLEVSSEAMGLNPVTFGRMLVHPAAPAEDLARLAGGMTPAQLTAGVVDLRPGELAMASAKLRAVREPWGERPADGEVLVMGPAEPETEGTGRAAGRETPWSTALTISSYAARGLRSRIVTGAGRSVTGPEALRHAVRRVVLARAMGAWGVALPRGDEADARVEVVALLLGLDARPPAASAGAHVGEVSDDFGLDAAGLRRRAAIVEVAERPQMAASLRRAAELVTFTDVEVERLCASLRPAAASIDVLLAEGIDLQARAALECAAFLREAAAVYASLGLGRPVST
jgi:dehydratase large subunit/dehydratase small subunit/cadherin-like protein